jgi:hypothetical protein
MEAACHVYENEADCSAADACIWDTDRVGGGERAGAGTG